MKPSFTISARGKQTNIKDYLAKTNNPNIDSVFAFTENCFLYGGREYIKPELDNNDLAYMYDNGIGYRIPLTNVYASLREYEMSRKFLDKYHRYGNSIILANEVLVDKFREDYPLFHIEASVIMNPTTVSQIDKLLTKFDTVVLHGSLNHTDIVKNLDNKDRIRLFAHMGCSLNCPNRCCYKYFSEINAALPITHLECSQGKVYRELLGMTELNIPKLIEYGFSKFKLLHNNKIIM